MQIKIGKRKYNVKKRKLNPKHYAEFDADAREILLQPNISKRLEAISIYHEILHGIFEHYIKDLLTPEEEEKVVKGIEKGWTEFSQNNPAESMLLQARLSLKK